MSSNFIPDVMLAGRVQSFEEQFDLLWWLSSKNGEKTFILLGRCSLSSYIISFCPVDDFVLVKVVDKPREHRVQIVQQKDVMLTNPRRIFNVRVATFLVNRSANMLKVQLFTNFYPPILVLFLAAAHRYGV